LILFYKNDI